MRILKLHSPYLSTAPSGENRSFQDEVKLLRQAGHATETWAPEPPTGRLSRVPLGMRSIWSMDAAREVRRRISRFRPDVVHVQNPFPMLSPSVIRTAAASGVPVLLTLSNHRLLCLPGTLLRDGRICEDCVGRAPWPGVLHACYRDSHAASAALATSIAVHRAVGTFDQVSLFIALSEFVRTTFIRTGIPPGKISVVPRFAWPAPLRVGPGDYFLYVGRLTPEKGVRTLLGAWDGADIPLVVAGNGDRLPDLLPTAPRAVEFRGQVPPEEVPGLIARARAVLVPSRGHEAFGRVVIEAYASGVPVVASRRGGLEELVQDGVTGLVVPAEDPAAWMIAVQSLLDDREAIRLGDGAREAWEERFTPERGLAALEAAYGAAASARS
jgi:glycosyltransferase involved in cell wall biosynthesis